MPASSTRTSTSPSARHWVAWPPLLDWLEHVATGRSADVDVVTADAWRLSPVGRTARHCARVRITSRLRRSFRAAARSGLHHLGPRRVGSEPSARLHVRVMTRMRQQRLDSGVSWPGPRAIRGDAALCAVTSGRHANVSTLMPASGHAVQSPSAKTSTDRGGQGPFPGRRLRRSTSSASPVRARCSRNVHPTHDDSSASRRQRRRTARRQRRALGGGIFRCAGTWTPAFASHSAPTLAAARLRNDEGALGVLHAARLPEGAAIDVARMLYSPRSRRRRSAWFTSATSTPARPRPSPRPRQTPALADRRTPTLRTCCRRCSRWEPLTASGR